MLGSDFPLVLLLDEPMNLEPRIESAFAVPSGLGFQEVRSSVLKRFWLKQGRGHFVSADDRSKLIV